MFCLNKSNTISRKTASFCRLITISMFVYFNSGMPAYSQLLPDSSNRVSFYTSDVALQKLFDAAETKAKWNIASFGKYQVLVEGAQYKNVWLETQPMGGYMYAKRNPVIARNNIGIFMDYQREDGRFPGVIYNRNGKLEPDYAQFQGLCFPGPAWELYFLTDLDAAYLGRVYRSLEKFDAYLWRTRDSDGDGCLETWCIYDTGEDHGTRFHGFPNAWPFDLPPSPERVAKLTAEEIVVHCKQKGYDSALAMTVPIESMDIMSYSYSCRDVLGKISEEIDNGMEKYWRGKAAEIKSKLREYLWDERKSACYDRDRNNMTMPILLHNNIRCMYFGSFDQEMADRFIRYHLMNSEEFWTPMPLPSVAVNDPYFRNNSKNDWSGQPESLTYQRSISALENYGHYAELTMIGSKFLEVMEDSLKFVQQFDPFERRISSSQKDGYGPCILATLEFISRLYGIHITKNRIYWSCLDENNQYEYSQNWCNRSYQMTTRGNRVFCFINGREVLSFTKGIRVITDLDGKLCGVVGVDTSKKKASVHYNGKALFLPVFPNTVYNYTDKFEEAGRVRFFKPGINERPSFNRQR